MTIVTIAIISVLTFPWAFYGLVWYYETVYRFFTKAK